MSNETSAAVPSLTIVYHPHVQRAGDRLLLTNLDQGVEISRAEPMFTQPGRERVEALGDRNLSRTPFRFENGPQDGEVKLIRGDSRTKIRVDDQEVEEERVFSAQEIRQGAVIELAERLLLVLHEYVPSTLPTPENEELVGASSRFEHVRREVARLAQSRDLLLLRGAPGTNAARIGREIHRSAHRTGRFVHIDLKGALERRQDLREVLLGSGAAGSDGEGALRRAMYGTLFLSHVEKAPTDIRNLLLSVHEKGEIEVGGHAEPIEVRIMGGSFAEGELDGPLVEEMARETLHLPPLRERREDLGRLILLFLRKELTMMGDRRAEASTDMTKWLPPEVVLKMVRYDWPGDLDELAEVVHQMTLDARGTDPFMLGSGIDELLG